MCCGRLPRTFTLYDYCTQTIPHDVLCKDVQELLESKRILVLLDNFETISKPHQVEILRFFSDLSGSSQTLLSTRYRPDWFLSAEQDDMYSMAHILVRVDGLSTEDATILVREFLRAKSFPQHVVSDEEITRLIVETRNNPKTILAILGLVERGLSLPHECIKFWTTQNAFLVDVSRHERKMVVKKYRFSNK